MFIGGSSGAHVADIGDFTGFRICMPFWDVGLDLITSTCVGISIEDDRCFIRINMMSWIIFVCFELNSNMYLLFITFVNTSVLNTW